MSVAELVEQEKRGAELDFLFFWGHQPPKSGVDRSCLSQWWQAEFVVDGVRYRTAEHYMMAEKAALFGDREARQAILDCHTPKDAKAFGRRVGGFDDQKWAEHRERIVLRGNLAKFRQNPDLAEFLVNTGTKILVEASPNDRIWGIGLSESDQQAHRPAQWQGLNLLGFALMKVRDQLVVCT